MGGHKREFMQTDRLQADEVDFSVPQVGGWLLFLCAVLILVYPATVLYAVLANGVPKAIASHSAKRTLLLGVYCTVFTTLAMFSVSAGLPGHQRWILLVLGRAIASSSSWIAC